MYCKSVENAGITSPPADFIAAVDPVAVQIRNPLEREWINGVTGTCAYSYRKLEKQPLD